jgi:hypothetical protein
MKLTAENLRRIVLEEMAAYKNEQQRLAESKANQPIQLTAEYLNQIIREEYAAYERRQRLAEARR